MSRLTRRGLLSSGSKLTASLSPISLSGVGTGSTVNTSGTATIAASQGSGAYSYAWERVSGSTGVTASSPSAQTTGFTTTGLTADETRSAVFRGVATDNANGIQAQTSNTVSISLTRSLSALVVSLSPSSLSGSSTGATVTTSGSVSVSASGGSGSYSYAWERVSGSTVPTPTAVTSATTSFTTSSIAAGATQDTVWRCIVTDTVTLNSAPTGNVSISLTRNFTTLSVTAAPGSLSASGASTPVVTSGTATASVSGGSGSWTGVWEWDGLSSTGSVSAVSPANVTTTFQSADTQATGTTRTMGMRYRVTDNVTGLSASSNSVSVSLTRYATLSASVSPTSLSGTSPNAPVQTSASATVTASGGSGSYSYAWLWNGTGTGGLNPTGPTSAITPFASSVDHPSGTTITAGFFCRVTDTVTGLTEDTAPVSISLIRTASGITTASISPPSQTWPYESPSIVHLTVNHDGIGPFSYSWSGSPDFGTIFGSANSVTTSVERPNGSVTVNISCLVTDNGAGGAFVEAIAEIIGV